MSIQTAIDVHVDCAVDRRDFKQALRIRWMSHANYNTVIDSNEISIWLQSLKLAKENSLPLLGK